MNSDGGFFRVENRFSLDLCFPPWSFRRPAGRVPLERRRECLRLRLAPSGSAQRILSGGSSVYYHGYAGELNWNARILPKDTEPRGWRTQAERAGMGKLEFPSGWSKR